MIKLSKPRGCQSLIVHDRGDHLELALLVVYAGQRRKGIGTEAVRRVQSLAAELNKPVMLEADRPKWRSLSRFYGRLGFKQLQGAKMKWEAA